MSLSIFCRRCSLMDEKVTEQVIQIMTEQWKLPEDMVRSFLKSIDIDSDSSLENLRLAAGELLHEIILEDDNKKPRVS